MKGKNCVEKKEERSHEHDQAAKAHLVLLMQKGYPWQKAAAMAGVHISRSTAYRRVQAVQTRGEAAFQDARQGHPAKLRAAVLQWLVAACRANPQMPSRAVQAALQEQFGIHVSIGHLNRVRAQLGIGNHVGRSKKNSKRRVLYRKPSGKRVLAPCSSSPPRKRQDCWKPPSMYCFLLHPIPPHALLTSLPHHVKVSYAPCSFWGLLFSHATGIYAATPVMRLGC